MADIHIEEKLDRIDYTTVALYRFSFLVSAFAVACLGFGLLQFGIPLLITSALIASACVHLYDKTIRWFIQGCAIFAVCLFMANLFPEIAIGASLVSWCGLSIKEYYCFRIRLIRITPFVLVLFWVCFALPIWIPLLYLSSGLSALLLFTIGIAKFRQPFHFDIGDKSKFQV
ncbi:DUF2301 domain-containing membrane protein [Vibrio rumoiensis]|uniref:Uncharacterized protein n=1 Tax=Vibrio rumoiensis 1S-45 TaxID=1188252 RepID=A0A1E5E2K1_9VIBR|nr:DUF2301 domain-containing membrane protein [Vibrio rumoiensis]OEF25760.1 hypothetical protein A1QC_08310 [Vibrio rumoiensis 1S-45]